VTASEEQAGSAPGRDSLDRVRADQERGRRPAAETPAPDQGDVETADLASDGDIASEHEKLTVADDPLDKPAETDATN
jgi:hypothetical protein